MFATIIRAAILALVAASPLNSLAVRDAGALAKRLPQSVSYTINDNFLVNSAIPPFAGPFDPDNVQFNFQGDGNAVVYFGYAQPQPAVWSSKTAGHDAICSDPSQCYMYFTANGDLLISIANKVVWHTGTANKGYLLVFHGIAPYIVIYNRKNQAVWKSSPDPAPPPPTS